MTLSSESLQEADLIAHCGQRAGGSYLYTLMLTGVVTGWTECLALLYRGQEVVLQELDAVQRLMPFLLSGLDTDNVKEFLNEEFLHIVRSFARGRTDPWER